MAAETRLVIKSVKGVQVFDSRNDPTVACAIKLSDGKSVVFKVPSGASTGEKEAVELRDGGTRFRGKGVLRAVENINSRIAPLVEGRIVGASSQEEIDSMLISQDGSPNKTELGANAILAVSGAFARARAHAMGLELWEYFAAGRTMLPVPQLNVLNAGRHADTGFEVQETMVLPVGAESFAHAMELGTGVWHALKGMLKAAGKSTGRGDEGGFVNPFRSIEETIEAVLGAIKKCGSDAERAVKLGFDGAFSEIHGRDLRGKETKGDDTYHLGGKRLSPEEVVAFWERLARTYPIISIEDGMGERDARGWKMLTKKLGSTTQLVLDDFVCTNPLLIRDAIRDGIGNSSLIKLNQIGTVSETLEAMGITRNAGRSNVISHRSGETEDDFIAHLAMCRLVDQIKSGSSGADRNAKYNTLLMIEAALGKDARYAGLDAFPQAVREHWMQRI